MARENIYKESFRNLIKQIPAEKMSNYYIGVGNPNSEILIVGREGATEESENGIKERGEISFADSWAEEIKHCRVGDFSESRDNKPLPEGCTWVKYQKLHDYIYGGDGARAKNTVDFLNRFFTTEMNVNRAKNTKNAPKDGMQERKDTFMRSDFIQQFPVTILACGDYIKNNDEIREIDDIFGVTFDRKYPNREASNRQAFWTHYNPDRTRLVIHTRQLSTDVTNELLIAMAEVIKKFLRK